jgi:P27 family predicted phage terminase small subunit
MPQEKIPAARKRLSSTLRESRERPKTAAQALDKAPRPPKHLPAAAQAEWRALMAMAVELGTITAADLRAFEMLCCTLATVSEAETAIRMQGLTLATENGGQKSHPAIKIMETGRAQAAALLRDFGLTPKARNHVAKAPALRENKFEEFIRHRR